MVKINIKQTKQKQGNTHTHTEETKTEPNRLCKVTQLWQSQDSTAMILFSDTLLCRDSKFRFLFHTWHVRRILRILIFYGGNLFFLTQRLGKEYISLLFLWVVGEVFLVSLSSTERSCEASGFTQRYEAQLYNLSRTESWSRGIEIPLWTIVFLT